MDEMMGNAAIADLARRLSISPGWFEAIGLVGASMTLCFDTGQPKCVPQPIQGLPAGEEALEFQTQLYRKYPFLLVNLVVVPAVGPGDVCRHRHGDRLSRRGTGPALRGAFARRGARSAAGGCLEPLAHRMCGRRSLASAERLAAPASSEPHRGMQCAAIIPAPRRNTKCIHCVSLPLSPSP